MFLISPFVYCATVLTFSGNFTARMFLGDFPLKVLAKAAMAAVVLRSKQKNHLLRRVMEPKPGGGFKYFLCSSIFIPIPGEMIQFDEHIFQGGWFNHQLDGNGS